MIVILAALLGATIGAMAARRRNGSGLDMAQYGAGYAIAFAILGLFATLAIDRLAG